MVNLYHPMQNTVYSCYTKNTVYWLGTGGFHNNNSNVQLQDVR